MCGATDCDAMADDRDGWIYGHYGTIGTMIMLLVDTGAGQTQIIGKTPWMIAQSQPSGGGIERWRGVGRGYRTKHRSVQLNMSHSSVTVLSSG